MPDEPDTWQSLGSVAARVVRAIEEAAEAVVAERAATDATTNTLARREAEIRERAGEAIKPAAE